MCDQRRECGRKVLEGIFVCPRSDRQFMLPLARAGDSDQAAPTGSTASDGDQLCQGLASNNESRPPTAAVLPPIGYQSCAKASHRFTRFSRTFLRFPHDSVVPRKMAERCRNDRNGSNVDVSNITAVRGEPQGVDSSQPRSGLRWCALCAHSLCSSGGCARALKNFALRSSGWV